MGSLDHGYVLRFGQIVCDESLARRSVSVLPSAGGGDARLDQWMRLYAVSSTSSERTSTLIGLLGCSFTYSCNALGL